MANLNLKRVKLYMVHSSAMTLTTRAAVFPSWDSPPTTLKEMNVMYSLFPQSRCLGVLIFPLKSVLAGKIATEGGQKATDISKCMCGKHAQVRKLRVFLDNISPVVEMQPLHSKKCGFEGLQDHLMGWSTTPVVRAAFQPSLQTKHVPRCAPHACSLRPSRWDSKERRLQGGC